MDDASKPTCFIAMPITTHVAEEELYGDPQHWIHVMEHLFVPAIQAAGFDAVRPVTRGSAMIHAEIVRNLETCDMVLCDLSGGNSNVFFELGVRTSLDKPIAIVRDEHTNIPFDLGGLNAHSYGSRLNAWELTQEVSLLRSHLGDAVESCKGSNPMWTQYGLTMRAQEAATPEGPLEAKIQMILGSVERLTARMDNSQNIREPVRVRHVAESALLAEFENSLLDWQVKNGLLANYELSSESSNSITLSFEDPAKLSAKQVGELHALGDPFGYRVSVSAGHSADAERIARTWANGSRLSRPTDS